MFGCMYYNADGSVGGMCGNGGRCTAVYRSLTRVSQENPRHSRPSTSCTRAQFTAARRTLCYEGSRRDLPRASASRDPGDHYGARHRYRITAHRQFVQDLGNIPLRRTGRTLREHARFAPQGTNVNFVETIETSVIAMRTYERGVEAETLACGTGSVASAVIAHLEYGLRPPIRVRTWSGDLLRCGLHSQKGLEITDVMLEGPAVIVFQGKAIIRSSEKHRAGS